MTPRRELLLLFNQDTTLATGWHPSISFIPFLWTQIPANKSHSFQFPFFGVVRHAFDVALACPASQSIEPVTGNCFDWRFFRPVSVSLSMFLSLSLSQSLSGHISPFRFGVFRILWNALHDRECTRSQLRWPWLRPERRSVGASFGKLPRPWIIVEDAETPPPC